MTFEIYEICWFFISLRLLDAERKREVIKDGNLIKFSIDTRKMSRLEKLCVVTGIRVENFSVIYKACQVFLYQSIEITTRHNKLRVEYSNVFYFSC